MHCLILSFSYVLSTTWRDRQWSFDWFCTKSEYFCKPSSPTGPTTASATLLCYKFWLPIWEWNDCVNPMIIWVGTTGWWIPPTVLTLAEAQLGRNWMCIVHVWVGFAWQILLWIEPDIYGVESFCCEGKGPLESYPSSDMVKSIHLVSPMCSSSDMLAEVLM